MSDSDKVRKMTYSTGMPVSLGSIYAIQNKFGMLKYFCFFMAILIGIFIFGFGYSVSVWGLLVIIAAAGLILHTVRKVEREDMDLWGEPLNRENDFDWFNFHRDGTVKYSSDAKGVSITDNNYSSVIFNVKESTFMKEAAAHFVKLETVHIIGMKVHTNAKGVQNKEYPFAYYSRRSFLLPYLYEMTVSNKKAKVSFVSKVKIDPQRFKGKDFLTTAVNNYDGKYIKPPFLFNAGRITGKDDGVVFILGLKTLSIKYENIELYAYPSSLDDLVDFVLIFEGNEYMFKLNITNSADLIPDYVNYIKMK